MDLNVPSKTCYSSTRKQNKLNKYIETQKEKFTQLDLQDVEVREKIKHSKSKNKKLQKQLEKDKEKVCWTLNCRQLLHNCFRVIRATLIITVGIHM